MSLRVPQLPCLCVERDIDAARATTAGKKMASQEEGHLIRSLAAINYRLVVVPVAIVILLNDDSVPVAMFVAITDDCTVAISIAVAVMPGADCYANRSDTNSNLFRARWHYNTNARNGGNYQSVFHHVLLHCETMLFKRDKGVLVPASLLDFACPHGTNSKRVNRIYGLLPHQAHPCCAAADHIEFACRSTAYVNDSTTAIRATISYAHDSRFTVTQIRNQHPRAKRQCSVCGCMPRWAGYLAACRAPAAIEGGDTAFSMRGADRYRR